VELNHPIQYGMKMVLLGSPEAQVVLSKLEVGSRIAKDGPVAKFEIPFRVFKSIKPDSEFVQCVCEDKGDNWILRRIIRVGQTVTTLDFEHEWVIPK
jgi:hypothetical protein